MNAQTPSRTRLLGIWRVMAQVAWIVLVLLSLVLFAIGVLTKIETFAKSQAEIEVGLSVNMDSLTRSYPLVHAGDLANLLTRFGS